MGLFCRKAVNRNTELVSNLERGLSSFFRLYASAAPGSRPGSTLRDDIGLDFVFSKHHEAAQHLEEALRESVRERLTAVLGQRKGQSLSLELFRGLSTAELHEVCSLARLPHTTATHPQSLALALHTFLHPEGTSSTAATTAPNNRPKWDQPQPLRQANWVRSWALEEQAPAPALAAAAGTVTAALGSLPSSRSTLDTTKTTSTANGTTADAAESPYVGSSVNLNGASATHRHQHGRSKGLRGAGGTGADVAASGAGAEEEAAAAAEAALRAAAERQIESLLDGELLRRLEGATAPTATATTTATATNMTITGNETVGSVGALMGAVDPAGVSGAGGWELQQPAGGLAAQSSGLQQPQPLQSQQQQQELQAATVAAQQQQQQQQRARLFPYAAASSSLSRKADVSGPNDGDVTAHVAPAVEAATGCSQGVPFGAVGTDDAPRNVAGFGGDVAVGMGVGAQPGEVFRAVRRCLLRMGYSGKDPRQLRSVLLLSRADLLRLLRDSTGNENDGVGQSREQLAARLLQLMGVVDSAPPPPSPSPQPANSITTTATNHISTATTTATTAVPSRPSANETTPAMATPVPPSSSSSPSVPATATPATPSTSTASAPGPAAATSDAATAAAAAAATAVPERRPPRPARHWKEEAAAAAAGSSNEFLDGNTEGHWGDGDADHDDLAEVAAMGDPRRRQVLAAAARRRRLMAAAAVPEEVASWLVKARAQDVVLIDLPPDTRAAPGRGAGVGSGGGGGGDGSGSGGSALPAASSSHVLLATALSQRHGYACVEAVRYQVRERLEELVAAEASASDPAADGTTGRGGRLGSPYDNAVPAAPTVSGVNGGDWVSLEAGNLQVHVLTAQARQYYRLEAMWAPDPHHHHRLHPGGSEPATSSPPRPRVRVFRPAGSGPGQRLPDTLETARVEPQVHAP